MTGRYGAPAAVLLLATLLAACEDEADDPGAGASSAVVAPGPSYLSRGTIYAGDLRITTGPGVDGYTRTLDGFVWHNVDDEVWFGDGEHAAQLIGRGRFVKADRESSEVAWVEYAEGEPAELVVWDTAHREEVLRTHEGTTADMRQQVNFYSELSPWPPQDTRPIAFVYAVEAGEVYWLNTDGAVRTEIGSGETTVLMEDADEVTIRAVENGVIASEYFDEDQPDQNYRTLLGPEIYGDVVVDDVLSSGLSRDGSYLVTGGNLSGTRALQVVSTADGSRVTDEFDYDDLTALAWTDDDTFQALSDPTPRNNRFNAPWDLLECEVETSTCSVVGTASKHGVGFGFETS